MPCPGCPIDCATHPHAARYIYICPIGLGVGGQLVCSCPVWLHFLSVALLQNGFGWGPLAMASYPVNTSDTETGLDSRISFSGLEWCNYCILR